MMEREFTDEEIVEGAKYCFESDNCADCPILYGDCYALRNLYIIDHASKPASLMQGVEGIKIEPAPTAIGTSSEQIKPKDSVTLLGENVKSPSKIAVDRAHDMLLAVYEMLLAVYEILLAVYENLPEEKQRAWDLEKIRPYEPNLVKAAWNVFGESYTYRQKYNQYKAKRRDEIKNKANENQLSLMDLEDKK